MKPSEYSKLINLLDIPTYEQLSYIFFYDCLTELTKYYMITTVVNEESGGGKLFKNQEKTIDEKSLFFDNLSSE